MKSDGGDILLAQYAPGDLLLPVCKVLWEVRSHECGHAGLLEYAVSERLDVALPRFTGLERPGNLRQVILIQGDPADLGPSST
jgi:hypothetical protein